MINDANVSESVAPDDVSARESLGAKLRQVREAQNISAKEAAERLKLDLWIIEALEKDDHAKLPEPAYVRGYYLAYLRLLELGPDLINMYHSEQEYELTPVRKDSLIKEQDNPLKQAAWIFLIIILIASGILLFNELNNGQFPAQGDAGVQSIESINDAATTNAENTADLSDSSDTIDNNLLKEEPRNLEELRAGTDLGVTRMAGTGDAVERNMSSDVTGAGEIVNAGTGGVQTTAGSGPDLLTLRIKVPSWVEIRDGQNDRLNFNNLPVGEYRFSGTAPFDVVIGNPVGIEVLINGQHFELPKIKSGGVGRFVVDHVSTP